MPTALNTYQLGSVSRSFKSVISQNGSPFVSWLYCQNTAADRVGQQYLVAGFSHKHIGLHTNRLGLDTAVTVRDI